MENDKQRIIYSLRTTRKNGTHLLPTPSPLNQPFTKPTDKDDQPELKALIDRINRFIPL